MEIVFEWWGLLFYNFFFLVGFIDEFSVADRLVGFDGGKFNGIYIAGEFFDL